MRKTILVIICSILLTGCGYVMPEAKAEVVPEEVVEEVSAEVVEETIEIEETIEEIVEEVVEEEEKLTLGQKNAIASAENYLSFMGFSRKRLILQLSSSFGDGYTEEEAEFAVQWLEDNGKVDWNEQAVRSAKNYLSFMGFSRDGLKRQLTSDAGEGYTDEQAEYALEAVGY